MSRAGDARGLGMGMCVMRGLRLAHPKSEQAVWEHWKVKKIPGTADFRLPSAAHPPISDLLALFGWLELRFGHETQLCEATLWLLGYRVQASSMTLLPFLFYILGPAP